MKEVTEEVILVCLKTANFIRNTAIVNSTHTAVVHVQQDYRINEQQICFQIYHVSFNDVEAKDILSVHTSADISMFQTENKWTDSEK